MADEVEGGNEERGDGGPREWLFEQRRATYARLEPRATAIAAAPQATTIDADDGGAIVAAATADAPRDEVTRVTETRRVDPEEELEAVANAPQVDETVWLDRLREYKQRKVGAMPAAVVAEATAMDGAAMPSPVVPGANNWTPLGPTVVTNGQALGNPAVAGRVSGLAIARDGRRIYAASANGGVFRSDDAGVTWRALMDAFDIDPTNFASTSLACGAIAIAPDDPDRVYVGTGEGDTHGLFDKRIVRALPAYRGIGPVCSTDGGQSWRVEDVDAGSPTLAGKAFYALAVDPRDGEHVVAATTDGLYERTLDTNGDPVWTRRRKGIFTSVIVTTVSGATRFYAAGSGGVVSSSDGATWAAAGSGFPAADVRRVALAAQASEPKFVFALVARNNGTLHGIFRLDLATNAWSALTNPPNILPPDKHGNSQGDYDLAIAVDPSDEAIIYAGGSATPRGAAIFRCKITAKGKISSKSIGEHAHADVHVLTHTPANPNALWCGSDGGVFLNRDPRGSGTFASRNDGLSCLCTNFLAQHPSDPHILFCGLQDNGSARTLGTAAWDHVMDGDGGYCLVNWADPKRVLVSANGQVLRSTNGGATFPAGLDFQFFLMTYPLAALPRNEQAPAEAELVAVAVLGSVFFSRDFGATFSESLATGSAGEIYCLAFATATRLFAGTTKGEVLRIEKSGGAWNAAHLEEAAGGALGVVGPVSDIAIDTADATGESLYITMGGMGDFRHVWHYDGTAWEERSGPAGGDSLLDVEHNAIVVDRADPAKLYAGADIGVWHSPDSGASWTPLSNGLPDAPVFDLQIHPSRRLLRAATHGRGVYELRI
ncbi:MAG TPA: hypothetical protein VF824_01790 [Thermoanaerobaculia bacterium]|jgi:hypothetical protein